MTTMQHTRPRWYTNQDDSAWERVKEAFRRDWDQTKHDFGGAAPDLNQQVGDTVSQATGSKPIPPPNARTPHKDDHDIYQDVDEPAYKYGYAAYHHFGTNRDWDAAEADLRSDWHDDTDWTNHRRAIHRGWMYAHEHRAAN
jgi:hypothetical protein